MSAVANIKGCCISVSVSVSVRLSGALVRSSSRPMTACVVARLPADNSTSARSPGARQMRVLQNTKMLSPPAFVRVQGAETLRVDSIRQDPQLPAVHRTMYRIAQPIRLNNHGINAPCGPA